MNAARAGRVAAWLTAAVWCLSMAGAARAAPPFSADDVDKGRAQYQRSCAQCHGLNMVNSGTTVYDLRRFPVDDPERFNGSVRNGKGNMPSFKDALTAEQIAALWAFVGSRGGKEMQ